MSGDYVDYVYTVNGIDYQNSSDYLHDKYGTKATGGRYYVKYDVTHPQRSDLLQNKPVPDSIKEAPPNGWDKIPGE